MINEFIDFNRKCTPPLRHHCVEPGVYCGAYPTLRNFRFLQRLKLKLIVSITPEEPTLDLIEFCKHQHIRMRHYSCEAFRDRVALNPTDILSVVEQLIAPHNHPVYVHCLDGRHVSGQVVMVLRKLLDWDLESIREEHIRWVQDEDALATEICNLADLSGTVTLPPSLPDWMWGGQVFGTDGRPRRHQTIKYRYPVQAPVSVPLPSPTDPSANHSILGEESTEMSTQISVPLTETSNQREIQAEVKGTVVQPCPAFRKAWNPHQRKVLENLKGNLGKFRQCEERNSPLFNSFGIFLWSHKLFSD